MKVYKYLSETADRRTKEFKAISNHYDSLCIKEGSRFVETKEAKDFADLEVEQAKTILHL